MKSSGVRDLTWMVLAAAGLMAGTSPVRPEEGKRGETPEPQPFPVSVVAAEGLIRKPANLFDLEGRTLRFIPEEGASWKVETTGSVRLEACDTQLTAGPSHPFGAHGWRVELPFTFPFAGKSWNALWVNNNGNISFEKSEAEYIRMRNPWASSGMRSMAAAIDARSAVGLEQMIAVCWAVYDPRRTKVAVQKAADQLVVTWNARRWADDMPVAGDIIFQARLMKSGIIEFAYAKVPERDGIVGLFTGQAVKGKLIHSWAPKGKAPHPSVGIVSATIEEAGSVLRCTLTMTQEIPEKVDSGSLLYRCVLKQGPRRDGFGVSVTGERRGEAWLDAPPLVVPNWIDGNKVTLIYSTVLLAGERRFHVEWDAVWWGHENRFVNSLSEVLPVALTGVGGELDLSEANGTYAGNLFEVFHYPLVTRDPLPLLELVYKKLPAEDDLALVLTDFRMDDLFGEGGGTGPLSKPIRGIGAFAEQPLSGAGTGNKRLQASVQVNWVGAPKFAPAGRIDDREWFNYGRGITWIAHEWTHRWGMRLRFRDPKTGRDEELHDANGHWRPELHAPPFVPVIDHYTPRAPLAHSIMNGAAWRENPDGTFSRSDHHLRLPGGFSALDLYAMGVIPPEQVPDTFLLRDVEDLGGNRYQANKVTVRIEDIIAAMGPREPPSVNEQKEYRLGVYVVHEPGREADAKLVSRAGELASAVADFFNRATGGRLTLIPPDRGK